MRAALAAIALILLAGCAGRVQEPGEPVRDDFPAEPTLRQLYLKAGHKLGDALAAGSGPVKEPSYPTANAYANEDLEVFTGEPVAQGFVATEARLFVHYAVDRPTVDVFRNGSGPDHTRHFVFWIGADGVYPAYEQNVGVTVLMPGTIYTAEIRFPLPPGGWHVAPGEKPQILVAPLIVQAGPPNLHYLVDHTSTPTRLEFLASPWSPPAMAQRTLHDESHEVAGNSGAFTGGGAAELSSALVPFELKGTETRLDVIVEWTSTAGGKSDLDLWVDDAAGKAVLWSTTPYQSEHVRAEATTIAALGPGTYTARIDVYSGVRTAFQVKVLVADAA